MRMWNVNPRLMCNKHILGEHVETHMFAGSVAKGKNLTGYIEKGEVELHNVKRRHDELAREIKRRGMNHKSPLKFHYSKRVGRVNVAESISTLVAKCETCRKYMTKGGIYDNSR